MKILVTLDGGNGQEREREEATIDVEHDMDVDIAAQDIISGWVLVAFHEGLASHYRGRR